MIGNGFTWGAILLHRLNGKKLSVANINKLKCIGKKKTFSFEIKKDKEKKTKTIEKKTLK